MDITKKEEAGEIGFWSRLFAHKLGRLGFAFFVLCVFISLFAYALSPDSSPNANRINPAAAYLAPNTSVFVYYPSDEFVTKTPAIVRFFVGAPETSNGILFSSIDSSDPTAYLFYLNKNNSEARVVYNQDKSKEKGLGEIKKTRLWLGTDNLGRDVFSRLLIGSRVSLSVGILAVLLSLIIGLSLGLVAGYFGGKIDASVMWLASVIWSLPTLLLVLAISFAIGKGFWQIFIAIGLSSWVELTRIVRGEVLSLKQKEFIMAAKLLHLGNFRILFRHLLPNVMPSVIVICTANFASAILLEAGLSFLGLGVKPPTPSWGMMINEYSGFMLLDNAYLAFIPGIAIMLLVIAVNFIGMGLRDIWAE